METLKNVMNYSDPLAVELIEGNTEINSLEFTLAAFLSFPAEIPTVVPRVGCFWCRLSRQLWPPPASSLSLATCRPCPWRRSLVPSQGWGLCLFLSAGSSAQGMENSGWHDELLVTCRRLSWNPLNTAYCLFRGNIICCLWNLF